MTANNMETSPVPSVTFLAKELSSSSELISDSFAFATVPLSGSILEGDFVATDEKKRYEESSGTASPESLISKSSALASASPLSVPSDPSVKKTGLALLPAQRMQAVHKNGSHFNLMITGETGTGKSTFINTLFGESIVPVETKESSIDNIRVHRAELIENDFSLKLTIVDTPSFGEGLNKQFSWSPAEKFLDEQFRLYLFQEEQPDRSMLFDSRIHCCVYLIKSTGKSLSQLDIETMKSLSERTNLIPIISKSDTFTSASLKEFKKIVKDTLERENIHLCEYILDSSVQEKILSHMPFAIIGAESDWFEVPDGRKVRGRKYDWGIAETDNPEHCDFTMVREILMGENMLDLILSTETHYENYRKKCLIDRFNEVKAGKEVYSVNHKYNGLEELSIFHLFTLQSLKMKIHETDTIYKAKEKAAKTKFAATVDKQEKRFREWKRGLIERQEQYNKEIEMLHLRIIRLQEEIETSETSSFSIEKSLNDLSLS